MKKKCAFICIYFTCLWASLLASQQPNIIFILADDLGYGELGCFGQTKIKTPNLDKLAQQGMKLTRHYSGSPVCAPSRYVLMTGKHPGHAFVRNNGELRAMVNGKMTHVEGQKPIPASEVTMAEALKSQGYTTGAFGKWGLGNPGSEGDPLNQGFDRFFGYNCQRHAHTYFTDYLWDNDKKIPLNNVPPVPGHAKLAKGVDPADPKSYEVFKGKDFSSDHIINEVLSFIKDNKGKPFFLYYPTLIPHLALHVPDDSVEPYLKENWIDPPDSARYTPHFTPRAAYAGMITRMDSYVGRVMALLDELKLSDNTILVFTSDNGPTYLGPMAEFFDSAGGVMRGTKGQSYEGGLKVPTIVRWPEGIAKNSTSDQMSGFEDWLPTFMEVAGESPKKNKGDGQSLLPLLKGESFESKKFLYREFAGSNGHQALWRGDWKAIRTGLKKKTTSFELYNLKSDPGESKDLAGDYPEKVKEMEVFMMKQRFPSAEFPIKGLDGLR